MRRNSTRSRRRGLLHLGRYGEILSVFVKYGFGDFLAGLNIERYLSVPRKFVPRATSIRVQRKMSRWERVRCAIEELGPSFIKFGQFMSNRPDILPPELITELEHLQDNVAPMSAESLEKELLKGFDKPITEVFAYFDKTPIASASIAQVHRGRLPGGEEVAVKVRRPRIHHSVRTDIDIIYDFVSLLEKRYERVRALGLTQLVDEFQRTITKEMDFTVEAAHMERFRKDFRSEPSIYVPLVYMEHTSASVLVSEYVHGIKVSETKRLREAGIDPKDVARQGTHLILRQIFDNGFFHADPHPGNILVLFDGRICFLDFGAVGIIPPTLRHHLSVILYGVVKKDPSRIVRSLTQVSREGIASIERLEYDVTEFIEEYSLTMLRQVDVGEVLRRFAAMIMEHDLRVVPGFYLLLRALISLEGVGRRLDPDFSLTTELEPHVRRMMHEYPRIQYVPYEIYFTLLDFVTLLKDLPFETRNLIRLVKQGGIRIQFEHRGLEPLIAKSDQLVNKLVFAIVLAALIVGSSVVIHSGIPPIFYGIPIIGIAGFILATIIGFGLLFSIIRGRRV